MPTRSLFVIAFVYKIDGSIIAAFVRFVNDFLGCLLKKRETEKWEKIW